MGRAGVSLCYTDVILKRGAGVALSEMDIRQMKADLRAWRGLRDRPAAVWIHPADADLWSEEDREAVGVPLIETPHVPEGTWEIGPAE